MLDLYVLMCYLMTTSINSHTADDSHIHCLIEDTLGKSITQMFLNPSLPLHRSGPPPHRHCPAAPIDAYSYLPVRVVRCLDPQELADARAKVGPEGARVPSRRSVTKGMRVSPRTHKSHKRTDTHLST